MDRIESLEAIRCLKAHYCDLCDTGYDADQLAALFTEDGVWDGGNLGVFQGREEVHRFFSNMPKTMSFAIHHVTNSAIQIHDDSNSATGRWYLLQTATLKESNRAVWVAGQYNDDLVRIDGEWKFRRVTIESRLFSPYEEGWATTPVLDLNNA